MDTGHPDRRRHPASGIGRLACSRRSGGWAAILLLGLGLSAHPQEAPPDPAAALHAEHQRLLPALRSSPFGEPLQLDSREADGEVEGEVHAEVPHPLAEVAAALRSAEAVCQLLFLHLNVRACHPASEAGGETLTLVFGPKRAQATGAQYTMRYALQVEAAGTAYLRVDLRAARGPLGTREHRITLEAIPTAPASAFVHLRYAYRYGALAGLTMGLYLASAGRSKIGFTITGQDADGQPIYLRGARAAQERNVMRYYLALRACLAVATGTPADRQEARLRTWFALTERYAPQLHEFDLEEYLREKHEDLAPSAPAPR